MKPTTIYTKRNIDTSNYVNTVTGETLFSEFPNTTSINIKDENLAIVNSDEYIIIDSKAFRYIQTIFSAQIWPKYNVSQTWLRERIICFTIKTEWLMFQ